MAAEIEDDCNVFQALAAPATAVRAGRSLNPVARGQQVLEEVSILLPEANKCNKNMLLGPARTRSSSSQEELGHLCQSSCALVQGKREVLICFKPIEDARSHS